MNTPTAAAARFSAYCLAISAAPDMTHLGEVSERMVQDDGLTDNQKDALEALAIARERALNWNQKGLTG